MGAHGLGRQTQTLNKLNVNPRRMKTGAGDSDEVRDRCRREAGAVEGLAAGGSGKGARGRDVMPHALRRGWALVVQRAGREKRRAARPRALDDIAYDLGVNN